MFFHYNKLVFCLLFVISMSDCMQADGPIVKRQRVESPKYPAICDYPCIDSARIREILSHYNKPAFVSSVVAQPIRVLCSNLRLEIHDANERKLVSDRPLNLQKINQDLQRSILLSSSLASNHSRGIPDMRSEQFSGLVECVLSQMDTSRRCRDFRSALRKITVRITALPESQIRILLLYGMRTRFQGAHDLFAHIYTYLVSLDGAIGHIAYPKDWLVNDPK